MATAPNAALTPREKKQQEARDLTKQKIDYFSRDAFKQAIAQALPKHLTPDRMVRILIASMNRVEHLNECSLPSIVDCMMKLSQFGLEPDGYHAHLIPYYNNRANQYECQLVIDYKGLVALTYRSGAVSNIHADVVCENDEFDYDRGEVKHHRPRLKGERGAMYCAYAICRFKDGSEKAEVMRLDEIEAIRSRSKAKKGPWETDFREMSKKTIYRRLSKWLPLSSEYRDAFFGDDDVPEETIRQVPNLEHKQTAVGESMADQLADMLTQQRSGEEFSEPPDYKGSNESAAESEPDQPGALDGLQTALAECEAWEDVTKVRDSFAAGKMSRTQLAILDDACESRKKQIRHKKN